jgi:hypothetical protein
MNTKLITALRTAARAIDENVFDYQWTEPTQCNCGVVVCSLLGVSANHLKQLLRDEGLRPKDDPTWRRIVGQNCPITGVPQSVLFQHLYRFGMTATEFNHLEKLDRPDIAKRAGFNGKQAKDAPDNLVKYLRAWADILTEQGAADTHEAPQPRPCNSGHLD